MKNKKRTIEIAQVKHSLLLSLIALMLFAGSIRSMAQNVLTQAENDSIYEVVKEMPEFPDGGMQGLMKYLRENTRYPKEAQDKGIQGRVVVAFVVEKDGTITDVQAMRSVDPALDAEAIRIVSGMPSWKPGKQNGEVVRVKTTVPVLFRLAVQKDPTAELNQTLKETGGIPVAGLEGVYVVAEQMPQFPGGKEGLANYLRENIHYPKEAMKLKIGGRVMVRFIVCEDGSISDLKVVRKVEKSLDMEALRVIALMPKWKPGSIKGKAVKVQCAVPVNFILP